MGSVSCCTCFFCDEVILCHAYMPPRFDGYNDHMKQEFDTPHPPLYQSTPTPWIVDGNNSTTTGELVNTSMVATVIVIVIVIV